MVHNFSKDECCDPALLQDRTLSASVSQVTICPKMDLVALVLDRVSVAIYRASWQRLTTISVTSKEDNKINCLAWSPDGACLALGTTAGGLCIYSVDRSAFSAATKAKRAARESAGPIASLEGLSSAPSCITWTRTISGAAGHVEIEKICDVYEDRAAMLRKGGKIEDEVPSCGLLFVGNRSGEITIYLHHLQFTVAQWRVLPKDCPVHQLHVQPDSRFCLAMGCEGRKDDVSDPPTSAITGCLLRSVDLRHIYEFWPEIERIGREAVSLRRFSSAVQQVCTTVKEEWINGASHVPKTTIMSPLAKLMQDFAEVGTRDPHEALHDVFCGARVNGAVLQFLATDLSENGAKEALRAFRSHTDVLADALHELLPDSENNMFRISEYGALARLSRYAAIGVSLPEADEFAESAQALFRNLGEFCWEVERVAHETEAFLAWLVIAAARSGGESMQVQNPSAVGNVEGEDARLVSQYFQGASIGQCDGRETAQADTISHYFETRLLPAFEAFKGHCAEAVSRPRNVIASSLHVNNGISLPICYPRPEVDVTCAFAGLRGKEGDAVHIVMATGEGNLISVKHEFGAEHWLFSRCGLLNEGMFVHQVATVGNEKLIFLLSDSPAGDNPESLRDKMTCEIALHEFSVEDYPYEAVAVKADDGPKRILLPEPVPFRGRQLVSLGAGQIEWGQNVSVTTNADRRMTR